MAESNSSNTAIVAIVILVIAALLFFYFMFVRSSGDDADIQIDVPEIDGQGASMELPIDAPTLKLA